MLVSVTTHTNHYIRKKKLRQINWSFVPLLSIIVPNKSITCDKIVQRCIPVIIQKLKHSSIVQKFSLF